MGNAIGKFGICLTGVPRHPHPHDSDPYDEGLGHSFCYIRPDPTRLPPSSEDSGPSLFRSISGASVSANTSTPPLSASFVDPTITTATATSISGPLFETSSYFSSAPLHPLPRSGPILDSGFMSGPLDRAGPMFSGPLDRSLSHHHVGPTNKKWSLIRGLRRVMSKPFKQNSVVAPVSNGSDPKTEEMGLSLDDMDLQWAQGKAGEDRVHVVVSEEDGWVFVGIYDGFNGPDATDFLSSNLYSFVQNELKGLSWDRERLQLGVSSVNHGDVLKAMSKGLHKSEEAYFEMSDEMIDENAELALMGSCVLVILIKGEDVYVMNVGDSRALLARNKDNYIRVGMIDQDLDRIQVKPSLLTFQLTVDHSTCVEEEVQRIRDEHPDDVFAILNDRVKGSLKVTRAFGAGFLKQPKWNNALLEMFRIDYVGTSPYLNCLPSLCHHRLGPKDQFLILSSDGLYQYFTNEEAVAEVELFISLSPEGDPAQHLVEEVLLRAAKKAGMDFYELLEIPQGDRRRYHDDVSIIIISFEGRIWRSCV